MIKKTVVDFAPSDAGADPVAMELTPSGDIPANVVEQIVRVTSELFPGNVRIEVSVDPEYPAHPSLVFHVRQASKSSGIEEEIDRELEWHAQVGKLAPESQDRLRLLLG